MEEVGFGLAHSRVTAIQRFDFSCNLTYRTRLN